MTKREQRKLLNALLKGLGEGLRAKIKNVPNVWDGFELRQWIADYAADETNYRPMNRARRREYNNERLIRNL